MCGRSFQTVHTWSVTVPRQQLGEWQSPAKHRFGACMYQKMHFCLLVAVAKRGCISKTPGILKNKNKAKIVQRIHCSQTMWWSEKQLQSHHRLTGQFSLPTGQMLLLVAETTLCHSLIPGPCDCLPKSNGVACWDEWNATTPRQWLFPPPPHNIFSLKELKLKKIALSKMSCKNSQTYPFLKKPLCFVKALQAGKVNSELRTQSECFLLQLMHLFCDCLGEKREREKIWLIC